MKVTWIDGRSAGGAGSGAGPDRRFTIRELGDLAPERRGEARRCPRPPRRRGAGRTRPSGRRAGRAPRRAATGRGGPRNPFARSPGQEDLDARQRLAAPLHLDDRHRRIEHRPVGVVVEEPLAVGGQDEVDPLPRASAARSTPARLPPSWTTATRTGAFGTEPSAPKPTGPIRLLRVKGRPVCLAKASPARRSRSPGKVAASPMARSARATVRARARSWSLRSGSSAPSKSRSPPATKMVSGFSARIRAMAAAARASPPRWLALQPQGSSQPERSAA